MLCRWANIKKMFIFCFPFHHTLLSVMHAPISSLSPLRRISAFSHSITMLFVSTRLISRFLSSFFPLLHQLSQPQQQQRHQNMILAIDNHTHNLELSKCFACNEPHPHRSTSNYVKKKLWCAVVNNRNHAAKEEEEESQYYFPTFFLSCIINGDTQMTTFIEPIMISMSPKFSGRLIKKA